MSRLVMEETEDSAVRKHQFVQVVGMLRNSPGNTGLRGARLIKAYKMHEYQQATTTIIHLKTPPLMLLILFDDPMRPEHFSGESTAHRRAEVLLLSPQQLRFEEPMLGGPLSRVNNF
ncbi:hypothetical protein HPB50_029272 [Hyalomma asiaticum]|nr:hypothetical protein HPB50_029272 [Hyalomma asiaticum]